MYPSSRAHAFTRPLIDREATFTGNSSCVLAGKELRGLIWSCGLLRCEVFAIYFRRRRRALLLMLLLLLRAMLFWYGQRGGALRGDGFELAQAPLLRFELFA